MKNDFYQGQRIHPVFKFTDEVFIKLNEAISLGKAWVLHKIKHLECQLMPQPEKHKALKTYKLISSHGHLQPWWSYPITNSSQFLLCNRKKAKADANTPGSTSQRYATLENIFLEYLKSYCEV